MANNTQKKGNNRAKATDMKSKIYQAKQEELQATRKANLTFLKKVCEALNSKIDAVRAARVTAEENGERLTKEDTKISVQSVVDYFENVLHEEYVRDNNINVIVNILVDVAKCQVNTKLEYYHAVIRLLYFYEKFEAYFGDGFRDTKMGLEKEYISLFSTHGYIKMTLEDDASYSADRPINNFIL